MVYVLCDATEGEGCKWYKWWYEDSCDDASAICGSVGVMSVPLLRDSG